MSQRLHPHLVGLVSLGLVAFVSAFGPAFVVPLAGQQAVRQDTVRAATLAPTVVTGTRTPRRPEELAFAVTALSAEQLRREPSLTAAGALTRLPSVAIEEAAGVGGPASLRLRGGEESFAQVMFDGVPLNLTGGFMDLQGLTMTNVERVEVARGPLSVMYGSSAISGAVQFITRAGRPGPARFDARVEGGRAGARGGQGQGEVGVSGGSERLRYSFGAGLTSARGIYRLPHDLRTWDASSRVDLTPSDAWQLTGTLRFMDTKSMLPVRDPGVTAVPLDPNQRDARTRLLASVTTRHSRSASWAHELTLSAARDDFEYVDESDGLDASAYPFFLFDANFGQTSTQWRKTAQYVASWRPGPPERQLVVSAGANVEREDVHVVQTGDYGDADNTYVRDNSGVFAEVQAHLGAKVDLTGGARFQRVEHLGSAFVPRLGAVWHVRPEVLRLRVSVGRAFKAPNLEQQFLASPFNASNPDLRPETSVNAEVGVEHDWRAAGLTTSVTVFRQANQDLIRLVPIDTLGRTQNQNLGESRARGLELQFDKRVSAAWHLGTGASWIETEMVENTGLGDALYPVGSPLLGVPRWTANLLLDGDVGRVSIAARGRLVGGQDVFTRRFGGARVTLDPYAVFGLTLRARVRDGLESYVRAENLFDRRFATAFDRPGMPFTLAAGMRVTTR